MSVFNQNVWGDDKSHRFIFEVNEELQKLFQKLWNSEHTPKALKIEINGSTRIFPEWGRPKLQAIRLPHLASAMLETGEIMSLSQFDDLLDAVKATNEELDKAREETNREIIGRVILKEE